MALVVGPTTSRSEIEMEIFLLRIQAHRLGDTAERAAIETRIDSLLDYWVRIAPPAIVASGVRP